MQFLRSFGAPSGPDPFESIAMAKWAIQLLLESANKNSQAAGRYSVSERIGIYSGTTVATVRPD